MEKVFHFSSGLTHAGVFHADDVFAAAFLKMLNPEIVIQRRTAVPEDFDGIVFDIGFGRFDHHQKDKEVRENGVPYAAFGLLWREYGGLLLPPEQVRRLDEAFVQKIDLQDNGGEPNEVSKIISEMVPLWDEEISMDAAFSDAVALASRILERKIRRLRSQAAAEAAVRKAMAAADSSEILTLEQFCPWAEYVRGTEYKYVIFPSLRGGYNVQGVTVDPQESDDPKKRRPLKVPFPAAWCGQPAEVLQMFVPGLTFVHPGGYLAAAETLEAARQAAETSLQIARQEIQTDGL